MYDKYSSIFRFDRWSHFLSHFKKGFQMFFFEAQTALERWHDKIRFCLFLCRCSSKFVVPSFCTKKRWNKTVRPKKLSSSSLVNHLNDVSWDGKHSSWKALKRAVGMTQGKIFTKDVIQQDCSLNVLMCPRMVCNFCLAVRALLSLTALPWTNEDAEMFETFCAGVNSVLQDDLTYTFKLRSTLCRVMSKGLFLAFSLLVLPPATLL